MELSVPKFRRVVWSSALYDVVVTAPLATPWTAAGLFAVMSDYNVVLGGDPLPEFGPMHLFVAALLGSVVMVWSALRLIDPQPRFGRFDAVARLLFSGWMVWALAVTGAPVLWLFLVPELCWGVVQLWPLTTAVTEQLS